MMVVRSIMGGYIKKRLLKEKWVEEECSSCGYNEIIIGKESVVIRLDYIDGDVTNNKLDNLRLLCPNCFYHTTDIYHQKGFTNETKSNNNKDFYNDKGTPSWRESNYRR